MKKSSSVVRCFWAKHPEEIAYHDAEWGVPIWDDDRYLFEMLTLEGAQAGLSWLTVLKRRENYRRAFSNFAVAKIARYDQAKIDQLLADEGIIRNRLKVHSVVSNARATQELVSERGSLSAYFWDFVDGEPVQNRRRGREDIPPRTELSDRISKDLKRRGFSFVGSTIVYAFMQAIGMVNDHTTDCFRHAKLSKPPRGASRRPTKRG